MRGIFGRKKKAAPSPSEPNWDNSFNQVKGGRVEILIISRSTANEIDPKKFAGASEFSGSIDALDRKFGRKIFVDNCIVSLNMVEHYDREVLNGGHGQYIENTKLAGQTAEWCRDGLARIKADDYLVIYDNLLRLAKESDQQIAFNSGSFDPSPEMTALDDTFYALFFKSEPISGYVKRYVLAQPWCVIVEDAAYEGAIERVWNQAQLT